MQRTQQTSTIALLVAGIGTVLVGIAGLAWIALDRIQAVQGRAIEDAANPDLTLPIVTGALLLMALAWTVWLWRSRGARTVATMVVSGITVLLLIATPWLTWLALSAPRDLTITSMICEAEALNTTGGDPVAGCEDAAVDTIVLLQGIHGDTQWVPDTSTDNLVRTFTDLPAGNWKTTLTVDGPDSTVAVAVVAERDGRMTRIGTLRPELDAASGELRWSGQLNVAEGDTDLRVQFFASANPAVESAAIRFDVRACTGQQTRTFNASTCQPIGYDVSFVHEQTPKETRTWRQMHVARDGNSWVVTNLEARTYTLEPDYPAIQMETQSTDVIIIPTAMEQVAENTVTAPGASSFDVDITPSTGTITYTIYVFPTGPTYAYQP